MVQEELEAKVRKAFSEINHPQYQKSLLDLEMMGPATLNPGEAVIVVKTPDQVKEYRPELEARIRRKLKDLPPDLRIRIEFEFDENLSQEVQRRRMDHVKHIIAVGSGKGGVGKSTVSSNLAAALAAAGHSVGLLDTDLYGPSIAKMFGLSHESQVEMVRQDLIKPIQVNGVKVMSFAFFVEPKQALIWRGPLLNNAVYQMLFEIDWGPLDYMIVDLPPGTGDVQLSLTQLTDVDGAIIVTTPQTIAVQDAERAIAMFDKVSVPILGVVENMAEYICPHCGKSSHVFSRGGIEHLKQEYGVNILGSIPLLSAIMQAAEEGVPHIWREPEGPVAGEYRKIVEGMKKSLSQFA